MNIYVILSVSFEYNDNYHYPTEGTNTVSACFLESQAREITDNLNLEFKKDLLLGLTTGLGFTIGELAGDYDVSNFFSVLKNLKIPDSISATICHNLGFLSISMDKKGKSQKRYSTYHDDMHVQNICKYVNDNVKFDVDDEDAHFDNILQQAKKDLYKLNQSKIDKVLESLDIIRTPYTYVPVSTKGVRL